MITEEKKETINDSRQASVKAPSGDAPNQAGKGEKLVSVENVVKGFDGRVILDGVSVDVFAGETLAIMGKSGTGKSVLLKLIARLLEPDSGKVLFRGEDIAQMKEKELGAVRKQMGFLFQGAALFDSMTIGENLEVFLMKHSELKPAEREAKIQQALSVVGLDDVIDKMPSELSGGMKKRAGLARSIVLEPELILYDEPTTGLDPVTASSIAELIISLQQKLGVASIVVTHDLPTAFVITDRAIVLNEGKKIYDGDIEEMQKSEDPFLKSYFAASALDRDHRDAFLKELEQKHEPANAA
jgi:phospholipid/cholesterol/gamma-HCH transport system ATP-binding protein